jgi:hypothetical protein
MKRLSAIDLQERLRSPEASVICVTRRRAPSVDDVVRRLEAACGRVGLDLFTIDGDDSETAALLPDLGVVAVPTVLVVSSGVLLERVCAVRDGVDARRLVALAAVGRSTLPMGAGRPSTTQVPTPRTTPPTPSGPSADGPGGATGG